MRGNRHEKAFLSFILCFVLLFAFSGCCTCGRLKADAADVIAGDSRAVGRLESTVAALDRTTSDSRERIANIIATSRGITDGVERVEYLFNQYEHEVERLLDEIDAVRRKAAIPGEDNKNSGADSDSVYNSAGSSTDSKN